MKYGDNLAEPQKLERFSGARVLVREILGKKPTSFHAAFTDQTAIYNKSVLHVILKNKEDELDDHMKALCLILNSSLGDWIITTIGRKSQRSIFRKIVNADLQDFPIPHSFEDSALELSKEYAIINSAISNNQLKKVDKLQHKINRLVSESYSLPKHLIKLMKQ